MSFEKQFEKMKSAPGFVAALDQSGGSTPKALLTYGVTEDDYANDDEMFGKVHEMRTRIMTNTSFGGDKIIGTILFEDTMDREIAGKPTPQYLWEEKEVVPILKVDKGLEEQENGVALMKPMPALHDLLARAKDLGVFGTKMRSVIYEANAEGIAANVAQQFQVGKEICAAGFVPIIEPEVDIHATDKAEIEDLLLSELLKNLDALDDDQNVMLKLTLPSTENHYRACIEHPRTVRALALSGGYSREDANAYLAQNNGMVASFSRALTEGLNTQQTDEEFTQMLGDSIGAIYDASTA